VFALVATAIQNLNEELEYPSLKHVTDGTPIFGGDESIDSLSLVNLLVNLEKNIGDTFGFPVALADEKAMSWKNSPYRTVGALVDFIVEKVIDHANASMEQTKASYA